MKKIISIISILSGISCLLSCQSEDLEIPVEVYEPYQKLNEKMNDSIKSNHTDEISSSDTIKSDPPIKDLDPWRIKK